MIKMFRKLLGFERIEETSSLLTDALAEVTIAVENHKANLKKQRVNLKNAGIAGLGDYMDGLGK